MAGLLRTQDPQAEEEQAQRRRDGQVDMEQRAVAPHALLVPAFDGLGPAQVHRPQPRMLAGDAGHAHPDGVDAVAHRGFGQAPVARHVPAARQRLGLAGVAPQQVVVGVDLAGHDDGFERQRGRSAARAVTAPVDPVPGLAGMAGPARAPIVGQRDRPPCRAVGGPRAIRQGLGDADVQDPRGAVAGGIGRRRPRAAAQEQQRQQAEHCGQRLSGAPRHRRRPRQSSRPRERAAWMARVREGTASLR